MNIPKDLPDCDLIQALAERASTRKDTSFPFLQRLDDFRNRVSAEVQFINQLFPEYTPHDEKYHLSRLFFVADKLLGSEKLAQMNSAEIFILACGLYGHDWGMAVNEDEKQFILTGNTPTGVQPKDLWVLNDEQSRIDEFAKKNGLAKDPKNGFTGIPLPLWQTYVRDTHALRSAERSRRYFEQFGEGIGEAAARVSEGHWLDFAELRDESYFPQDFGVLSETVNLRAIAVYVRLVDLLDIGNDRTPYVVWKYVAPRDSKSQMEWAKHRCLQPVTFPNYQSGRIVQVDGSTESHEVFAALEDLRSYCEEQLKDCKDTLAQMNDTRHFLDIFHLSWRVVPRGFKTPSIRFEFDRKRMFEILSDQIYGRNPYVFLRELLQNSIDAIKMRREVMARNNIEVKDLGTIHVSVIKKESGDVDLIWSDDGVGMDEYIVRNFLAVAGKSYYRSKEFSDERMAFDPISRFGIGMLSCFLLADQIEIETRRDSYITQNSRPLKISIPDLEKHFRTEYGAATAPYGTTVRVHIRLQKLEAVLGKRAAIKFNVTEFLQRTAGFVEFPIIVQEEGKTIVISHPRISVPDRIVKNYGLDVPVLKTRLGLDLREWTEKLSSDQLQSLHENFREVQVDLRKDLDISGYEGAISYLVPVQNNVDIAIQNGVLRLTQRASNALIARLPAKPYSTKKHRVYRDGIYVDDADVLNGTSCIARDGAINIARGVECELDISRSKFIGKSSRWDTELNAAIVKFWSKQWQKSAEGLNPLESLIFLAEKCSLYGIRVGDLWEVADKSNWPIPGISQGGKAAVVPWAKIEAGDIPILPSPLEGKAIDVFWEFFKNGKKSHSPLQHWNGGFAVIPTDATSKLERNSKIFDLLPEFAFPVERGDRIRTLRFIRAPWDEEPHWVQEILTPVQQNGTVNKFVLEEVAKRLFENPMELAKPEIKMFINRATYSFPFGSFAVFSEPYQDYFAYGWSWINMRHQKAQQIIRLFASYLIANHSSGYLDRDIKRVRVELEEFPRLKSNRLATTHIVKRAKKILSGMAKAMNKLGLPGAADLEIEGFSSEDFVPGTFKEYDGTRNWGFNFVSTDRKFGKVIN